MEELRRNLVIGGTKYSLAVGQYGSEPPGVNTQGKVGVTYLDTANKRLYICTAAVAGAGGIECTWTPVGELIEGQGGGNDSGQNANGLTNVEKSLILALFRNAAYVTDNMGDTLAQLETLWSGGEAEPNPDKTLTGISATYSGGSVAVGTAVSALTGIVVTAHYSDGSSATVTGYTLSGSIAEGSNTITVTYGGMTATITVVGVAEESGLEQYEYTIAGSGNLDNSGGIIAGPYNHTDYIQIDSDYAAVTLAAYLTAPAESNTTVYSYIQWFNGDTFISRTDSQAYIETGNVVDVHVNPVPDGATKFRISVQNSCERFALYKGEVSAEEVA